MQERPRFRTDLVAHPIVESGQRFVDVTDPDSGATFRFYEVEYAVACAMDGKRDFGGLVAWSQAELGLEPTRDELTTVVNTLDELGYLAPEASTGGAGDDVELGVAGRSPLTGPRPTVTAEDVELGHAGSTAGADEPTQVAASFDRGADAGADVSVDLSQHLSIDKSDVKEAVRQSRVISAVEAPEDLDDDVKTAVREPEPQARDAGAREAKAREAEPGSKPITIPEKAPPAKPAAPVAPEREPAAASSQPAPESSGGGAMTAVLIILLLAVLGVGAWFVYNNFLAKQDQATSSLTAPPPSPQKIVKKKS